MQKNIEIIRTLILPAALYGSEVSPCNGAALKALQAAIVNAIGPASSRRAPEIVQELLSTFGEVDPQAVAIARKFVLLYRIVAKYPSSQMKVKAILCAYASKHHKGTNGWLGLQGEDEHNRNFGPNSTPTPRPAKGGSHH